MALTFNSSCITRIIFILVSSVIITFPFLVTASVNDYTAEAQAASQLQGSACQKAIEIALNNAGSPKPVIDAQKFTFKGGEIVEEGGNLIEIVTPCSCQSGGHAIGTPSYYVCAVTARVRYERH